MWQRVQNMYKIMYLEILDEIAVENPELSAVFLKYKAFKSTMIYNRIVYNPCIKINAR